MPVPVKNSHLPASSSSESGSLLIIVAVLMLLVGTIVSFGISGLKFDDDIDRYYKAREQLEFINDQLASYVQRNRKLPSPGAGNTVPIKDLNLSWRYQKDPWGNDIYYAVSPIFEAPPTDKVFFSCRTEQWINSDSGADKNENPDKAAFCCPKKSNINQDLQIDVNGDGILQSTEELDRENAGNFYKDPDDKVDELFIDAIDFDDPSTVPNIEAYAVVLISHGADGQGITGTGAQNREFLRDGGEDMDDIMIWRTQLSLYGELGGASCFAPWE